MHLSIGKIICFQCCQWKHILTYSTKMQGKDHFYHCGFKAIEYGDAEWLKDWKIWLVIVFGMFYLDFGFVARCARRESYFDVFSANWNVNKVISKQKKSTLFQIRMWIKHSGNALSKIIRNFTFCDWNNFGFRANFAW